MKPISIKVYLVQILLVVLSASFAFLSLSQPEGNIVFSNATWGIITHGQMSVPIVLGAIPFVNLSLFLTFLFLYLLFEFYGFKMAIYTALAIALVVLGQFYLFYGLQHFHAAELTRQSFLSEVPLSNLNQSLVHALAAAIAIGFSAYFILAWLFKKLTKSYFMFFRYLLASAPGFFVLAFVKTYILKRDQLADISILMEALPQTMQFTALCLLTILPLYALRLILGAFRGRGFGVIEADVNPSQPLFKAQKPDTIEDETKSEPTKPLIPKPSPSSEIPRPEEKPKIIKPNDTAAAVALPSPPTQSPHDTPSSPSVFDLIERPDDEEITNATHQA